MKDKAGAIADQIRLLWRVAKHPDAPRTTRLVALAAAAYVVSPIQLIPTFIPVIGQLDDVLVLYLAARCINRTAPAPILAHCRAGLRCNE